MTFPLLTRGEVLLKMYVKQISHSRTARRIFKVENGSKLVHIHMINKTTFHSSPHFEKRGFERHLGNGLAIILHHKAIRLLITCIGICNWNTLEIT